LQIAHGACNLSFFAVVTSAPMCYNILTQLVSF
jgi:hypothetical protein